jgi:hypothetical protein
MKYDEEVIKQKKKERKKKRKPGGKKDPKKIAKKNEDAQKSDVKEPKYDKYISSAVYKEYHRRKIIVLKAY